VLEKSKEAGEGLTQPLDGGRRRGRYGCL
jgi:hypothetical protein